MRIIISLAFAALTVTTFTSAAHADGWTSTWTTLGGTSGYNPAVKHNPARVEIQGYTASSGDCSSNDTPTILLVDQTVNTLSPENGKEIYATVLSAVMSGKEVKFYITNCYDNRPNITGIQIK